MASIPCSSRISLCPESSGSAAGGDPLRLLHRRRSENSTIIITANVASAPAPAPFARSPTFCGGGSSVVDVRSGDAAAICLPIVARSVSSCTTLLLTTLSCSVSPASAALGAVRTRSIRSFRRSETLSSSSESCLRRATSSAICSRVAGTCSVCAFPSAPVTVTRTVGGPCAMTPPVGAFSVTCMKFIRVARLSSYR